MTTPTRTAEEPAWTSFDAFFAATYPRLERTMHTSGDDGLDALQEAYTQAATKWRRISRYDSPEAWVRRVAMNRLSNRRRSRRRERQATASLTRITRTVSWAPEGAHLDLTAAISELTPQQRVVVTLRYLEELTCEEISQHMDISSGAVRYHLHEARKHLVASMEDAHARP